MKYITRKDDLARRKFGWDVRIYALKGSRFFSDGKYGGRDGALQAAIVHRDKTLHAAGIPLTARTVVTRQQRGGTGIQGIHLHQHRQVRYYVVSYAAEAGRKKRKLFRIGEGEEARKATLKLAVAFRREQEQRIYGSTINANWRRSFGEVCK